MRRAIQLDLPMIETPVKNVSIAKGDHASELSKGQKLFNNLTLGTLNGGAIIR